MEPLNLISLPDILPVPTVSSVSGRVLIPGSKSYSNRALLLSFLAKGESCLDGFLDSEDTAVLLHLFQKWQVPMLKHGDQIKIQGMGGKIPPHKEQIDLENAGTAVRFLTAILTLGQGNYQITGNARMQQRPLKDLLVALRSVGCQVKGMVQEDYPPVLIEGSGFPGGKISVSGENSSQYGSAILLVSPYAKKDTHLQLTGNLVSHTYLDMTLQAMQKFGVVVHKKSEKEFFIPAQQSYQAQNYPIEPDASSASYFFALPAILGGEIEIKNIPKDSLQGDLQLLNLLEKMGCKVQWLSDSVKLSNQKTLQALGRVNMRTFSDVAPTFAVISLFANGETHIEGVENMRIKESDRIRAIFQEFQKIGSSIQEFSDGWKIKGLGIKSAELPYPLPALTGKNLKTYDDHRMAMCLTLVGLRVPGVQIENPACVKKTFPNFYSVLFSLFPS